MDGGKEERERERERDDDDIWKGRRIERGGETPTLWLLEFDVVR